MRLVELRVHRLPGIRPGFALTGLGAGMNVLTGPNGSGKSSVLRAVRSLLDPGFARGEGVFVEALFEAGEERLEATRLGDEVSWQRAGAPAAAPDLPDLRFLSCYVLAMEDLTSSDADTDGEIARRLARELAGGYDLAAVRAQPIFRPGARHGLEESKRLDAAIAERRRAARDNELLQEKEQALAGVRERLAAADAAAATADRLAEALELLAARRQQQALRLRMAALPAGLELLRGDEADRLASLRAGLRATTLELEGVHSRLEDAAARLARCGLAQAEIDDGDIAEAAGLLRSMQVLEPRREQLRDEAKKAESALATAARQLGGPPAARGDATDGPHLDPETIHAVEAGLARKRELDASIRTLRSQLDSLPSENHAGADLDELRRARSLLLGWLSSPPRLPWNAGRIFGSLLMTVSVAAALAALVASGATWPSIATAWPWDGPPSRAALLGAAFLAGFLLFAGSGGGKRREYRTVYRSSGAAPPNEWREAEVRRTLAVIDRELAARERRELDLERRAVLERELRVRLGELDEETMELSARAAEVGFDPQRLDASFERWLTLVRDVDRALAERNAARVHLERVNGDVERHSEALAAFLRRHGEEPGAVESAALAARLDRLAARVRSRDQSLGEIAALRRESARLERELRQRRQEIARLFEAVGLVGLEEREADVQLGHRLERLDDWRSLERESGELAGRERYLDERLAGSEQLRRLVADDDERTLRERLRQSRELAGRREEWAEEITRTVTLVEKAGQARTLERARASEQRARDELQARYQEALFAEAGVWLLDDVERQHETASKPALLRDAEEFFALFTRHRYSLRFEAPGAFAALDTAAGERRSLEELSTGTRAQLLLALRMAFALGLERGRSTLPLFLDEALTTADGERFRAVADSLALLALNGRQIFYLTARGEDAAFWSGAGTAATVIDVERLRLGVTAIDAPSRLALPERRGVPAPRSHSAEEYAVALGVPALDPWAPAESIHAFHLLRDDLGRLYRLLELGAERLGTVESLLASEASAALLDSSEERDLRLRCHIARAWLEGWRIGRGRPVDRAALESSAAVTPRFLDLVESLAGECEQDARRLVERLREGAAKGFQKAKAEQLREWLEENGYLDYRTPLAGPQLRQYLMTELAANGSQADRGKKLELTTRLCDFLEAGRRAALEPAQVQAAEV